MHAQVSMHSFGTRDAAELLFSAEASAASRIPRMQAHDALPPAEEGGDDVDRMHEYEQMVEAMQGEFNAMLQSRRQYA